MKIDTETAWAIIIALCVGVFVICMAYTAIWGTRWKGYGQSHRETLRFSAEERIGIALG